MIRTKDIGNPFAPAYRATIWVGDDDVPIGGFVDGTRSQAYVPAWGFLEQARDRAICERWALADSRRAVQLYSGRDHMLVVPVEPKPDEKVVVQLCDNNSDEAFYGGDAAAAYKKAAAKLLAEDPTLGEGLYL